VGFEPTTSAMPALKEKTKAIVVFRVNFA
jgi:hypothetical protein